MYNTTGNGPYGGATPGRSGSGRFGEHPQYGSLGYPQMSQYGYGSAGGPAGVTSALLDPQHGGLDPSYSRGSAGMGGVGGSVLGAGGGAGGYDDHDETSSMVEEALVEKGKLFPPPAVLAYGETPRDDRRKLGWVDLLFDFAFVVALASVCWLLKATLFQVNSYIAEGPGWVIHDALLVFCTLWTLWLAAVNYFNRFGGGELAHYVVLTAVSAAVLVFAVELPSHVYAGGPGATSILASTSPILATLGRAGLAVRVVLFAAYLRLWMWEVATQFAAAHIIANIAFALPMVLMTFALPGVGSARALLWTVFVIELSLPAALVLYLPSDWNLRLTHHRFVDRFGAVLLLAAVYTLSPVALALAPPPAHSKQYSYWSVVGDVATSLVAVVALMGLYSITDAAQYDRHALRRSWQLGLSWLFAHALLIASLIGAAAGLSQLSSIASASYSFSSSPFGGFSGGGAHTTFKSVQATPVLRAAPDGSQQLSLSNPNVAAAAAAMGSVVGFIPAGAATAASSALMLPLAPLAEDGARSLVFLGVAGVVLAVWIIRTVHERASLFALLSAREARARGEIPGYSQFSHEPKAIGAAGGPSSSGALPRPVQVVGLLHLALYVVLIGTLGALAYWSPEFLRSLHAIGARAVVAGIFLLLVVAEALDRLVAVSFLRPSRNVSDAMYDTPRAARAVNYDL